MSYVIRAAKDFSDDPYLMTLWDISHAFRVEVRIAQANYYRALAEVGQHDGLLWAQLNAEHHRDESKHLS